MHLSVSEILKLANSKSKIEERVDVLQKHNTFALRHLLRYCFQPSIKWLLPEGDMGYIIKPTIDQEGNFYNRARELYLFVEGGEKSNPNLTDERRAWLWIQLIEGIDHKDAELLMKVKDKIMPFKNINEKVVLQAFPGLY
jgi:hypothetical protein